MAAPLMAAPLMAAPLMAAPPKWLLHRLLNDLDPVPSARLAAWIEPVQQA